MSRCLERALFARTAILVLPLSLAVPGTAFGQSSMDGVRTGAEAFGGWEAQEPGVRRLIRPEDLPEPYATRSSSNAPGNAEKPADVLPRAMDGFVVTEFDAGLSRPRVIAPAPNGDVFVAESGADRVLVYRLAPDGSVASRETFAEDLNRPYGIAFHPAENPRWVYVANTDSVVRYPWDGLAMAPAGEAETIVESLPTGGHWTRDIVFSADGETLFVAVGSQGNVSEDTLGRNPPDGFVEANPPGAAWGDEAERAAVLAFTPEGEERRIYATGLRNCSGMTLKPDDGALWCVVNERDGIGDDLPPDYATAVEEGAFYGWPWYYTTGSFKDPRLDDARPDLADSVRVPDVLLQPHSAPLGIAFYDHDALPEAWRGDAFVALHGSWNRDRRTGYKVVRLLFEDGRATGVYQDFLTGFVLDDDRVWGRPVDVAVTRDGALLVSDDGSGRIWRVAPEPGTASIATE